MLKVGLGDGEEAAGKRRGSVETEGEARASLWRKTSRSLVWKAVALVLAYHPPPRLPPPPCPSSPPPPRLLSSFLGGAAPLLLTYSFRKRAWGLIVFFPPSGTRPRKEVLSSLLKSHSFICSWRVVMSNTARWDPCCT